MSPTDGADGARPGGAAEVSVLDQALWARFSEDQDLREFSRVWLALQLRFLGPAEAGAVVLQTAEGLVPTATWPKDHPTGQDLAAAIERAIETGAGVMSAGRIIAQPLIVDGEVLGAAGFRFGQALADPPASFRALQWGTGWLGSALRRDIAHSGQIEREKQAAVLEVLGAALDASDAEAAALAAATQLARRLECNQVSVGWLRRRRMRLKAISDVAELRMNTGFSEKLCLAMAEATDQEGSVLFPRREGQGYTVDTQHAALAKMRACGEILSVPMFDGARPVGALSFEKPPGEHFTDLELMAAEAVAPALGPLLAARIRAERAAPMVMASSLRRQIGRVIGPGYVGRKLALLALAAIVAVLAVAKGDYRVAAQSQVEGQVVRSLVAPFDGHVAEQFVRAGDVIRAGAPLAALDDSDLQIELIRWNTDLARYQGEYDRALSERDAAAARIAAAEIEQARAKAGLVSRQIARAALAAPFDAVVIEGDLSQSLGRAVRRGEELFQIAPLDSYRVTLEVDERQLGDIAPGQQGTVLLSSLPDQGFPFEIIRVTPQLEAAEGRNFALAEGRLLEGSPAIRPGMRGVAKVDVEERLLVRIWAQPIIDWMRLALWRWMP